MKYLLSLSTMSLLLFTALNCTAQQDKSKRPSPPATVTQMVGKTTIAINYSQPSVKGRTIGVDLEPMPDKVWRAGANEATVFETDKDIMVEGKTLPKGKYGFFILVLKESWVLIFNKTWDQWGAFKYKEADDVLRVPVRSGKGTAFAEKLTYKISADGIVTIAWGDMETNFTVQEKK